MNPERVSDPFGYWKCSNPQKKVIFPFFSGQILTFFLELKTVLSGNAVLNPGKKVRIPPPHPYLAPVSRNRLYSKTTFSGNTVLD